jgi:hypothetical protein
MAATTTSPPPQSSYTIDEIINQIYRELSLMPKVVVVKETLSADSFRVIIPSNIILLVRKENTREDYYSCILWFDRIPVNDIDARGNLELFHITKVHNICSLINRLRHFVPSTSTYNYKTGNTLREIANDISRLT